MLTLKIGTREIDVHESLVAREADRMFKLSPERRAHRLAVAKAQIARAGGTKAIDTAKPGGAVRKAAAIILSDGSAVT
jgi:hypothetical protein